MATEPVPAEVQLDTVEEHLNKARSEQSIESVRKELEALKEQYATRSHVGELSGRIERMETKLAELEAKVSPSATDISPPEVEPTEDDWVL
jgi:polyhydroxyalkanoate synthesis regulator phasin